MSLDVKQETPAAQSPPPSRSVAKASRRFHLPGSETRDAVLRRLLAAGDVLTAITVSALAGAVFTSHLNLLLWGAVIAPLWVVLAKLYGLYDRDQPTIHHSTVDELPAILAWTLTCTVLFAAWAALSPADELSLGVGAYCWISAAAIGVALRVGVRSAWRRLTPPESVMIVGAGIAADAVRRKLELFDDLHVNLVRSRETVTPGEIAAASEWLFVDRIILAGQAIDDELIAPLVAFCRSERVKLSVALPASPILGTAVQLNRLADLPLVEYNTWDIPRSTMFLKRLVDVTVAAVGLILVTPVFVLVGVAVKLGSRGPILFSQERVGMGGRRFRLYKFRTMVADAEAALSELISFESLADPMFKLENDPRVTRVGRVLRRTSLDELPQLWNVLVGEMSLVGPRPEQVELVERYREEHLFRLNVKPGMTGPMQVHGRGELSFQERLAVEREYIENLSLRRDLQILVLTVSAVIGGRGAF